MVGDEMTDEMKLLSKSDIMAIPQDKLPMAVLADSLRSFFGWGIKVHEQGAYNHFCWLVRPGWVASQEWLFSLLPVSDYFDKARLKLWHCPGWTAAERKKIIDALDADLARPWYRRVYDVPAILGQLVWHEIQIPGLSICSDKAGYIRLNDPSYGLRLPDPAQVNTWLSEHEKYRVYGRYVPD
jgi:hypothetical protein